MDCMETKRGLLAAVLRPFQYIASVLLVITGAEYRRRRLDQERLTRLANSRRYLHEASERRKRMEAHTRSFDDELVQAGSPDKSS